LRDTLGRRRRQAGQLHRALDSACRRCPLCRLNQQAFCIQAWYRRRRYRHQVCWRQLQGQEARLCHPLEVCI
jgi:Zn-dependent alcohol dehydrogenase